MKFILHLVAFVGAGNKSDEDYSVPRLCEFGLYLKLCESVILICTQYECIYISYRFLPDIILYVYKNYKY